MRFTRPQVFRLAGTRIDPVGMRDYLSAISAQSWSTDTENGGEYLVEVAGKTCYRSFTADLNPNLTKVRDHNNTGYIENILKQWHGSVLEHVHETFALVGVSRVLTHEMVRHRLANFSQESLRFVRLTELLAFYPSVFSAEFLRKLGVSNKTPVEELFAETFEHLEDIQLKLANALDLDGLRSFDVKKKLTSAMRRLAPIGLSTTLIMTSNARNWRHIVANRTSRHAEEEIRIVVADIFEHLRAHNPAFYQDAQVEQVDGINEVTFEYDRV